MKKYIVHILLLTIVASCSVAKRVPDDSYLLNKVRVVADRKDINESNMESFLRQRPNGSFLIFGRALLKTYNIAENDSTWLNRLWRRVGEPPVIFSDRLTEISAEQIRLQLNNKGFLNAEVDTIVVRRDKKADVTYKITGNEPYRIRSFTDTIRSVDTTIYNILRNSRQLEVIRPGSIFDLEALEQGRTNITQVLRNRGYYNISKENFYFLADTTLGSHQVDLILGLNFPNDTMHHKQYRIGQVTIMNGVRSRTLNNAELKQNLDTVEYNNIRIVSEKERFMRPRALYYNTYLRPGRLYADRTLERTYSALNGMTSIGQTNIVLTPSFVNDSAFINADISITPARLHYTQFGIDGTNSSGDLGVAANTTYEHRNFLKGGERFRVKVNGAYEYIPKSSSTNLIDRSYYEYGAETSLAVPQLMLPWLMHRLREQPSASTEFALGINFQKRPEYLRQFFNLSSQLQWAKMNGQLINTVKPLDITYVRMPWKSDRFEEEYLNESNPILRLSYEEQLVASTAYSFIYTNSSFRVTPVNPFRIRFGVEMAGLVPRMVSAFGGGTTSTDGQKMILGTHYAEYLKFDFEFAKTFTIDYQNALAVHLAAGVVNPYGNSIVVPFEKRYFGGGANGVRGWSTRTLGPGAYSPDNTTYFTYTVGDVKLDGSIEFRRKLTPMFELATFVDAGNVWTIREYEKQEGGLFRFDDFYKQIAVSYGLGMRLDLNFMILRLDLGMKAHNPALPSGQRWTIFKPDGKRDPALHFAIGYPF